MSKKEVMSKTIDFLGVEWKSVETPTYNINNACEWILPPKMFCKKVFGYDAADLEGMPMPQPQDENGQFLFGFMQ